jgi:hypothetical protein
MKLQHLLLTTLLACSASAYCADSIKPGLWEMTNQMQGAGGGEAANAMAAMQKEMASMPAEQRKMMQDMLAKQGMQISSTADGAMAVKMCMTQEMIDRNEVAPQDGNGNCTHTNSARTGNSMKFSFVCTKPASSGEGEVNFTSPEAYTSRVVVKSMVRGKPETMDMRTSGRWLGKDCGNIKPLAIPNK